jgi:chromosome segregation ATPase/pSer/pThr/pTyr-binding forkhead associated (FHA) protein
VESESANNAGIDSTVNEPAGSPFARLVIRGADGKSVTKNILRPTTLVGSVGPCNIELIGPSVGPSHCVFAVEGDGLRVHDLRATSGTWLNGQRIDVAPLAAGDVVRVGEFECLVETNLPRQIDTTNFAAGSARLVIAGGDGRSVVKDVFRPTTLGGSRPGCNIQFAGPDVAAAHFLITVFSGWLRIRDLRTRFPTRVNGQAVSVWTLGDGDEIEVGPYRVRVETSLPRAAESADDQLDPRFGPSPALLTQEAARVERERAEIAAARQALDAERVDLDRLHAEIEQLQNRVREESDALTTARANFDKDLNEHAAQRAALEADRDTHRLAAEALTTRETASNATRAELEADRHSLANERAVLIADRTAIETLEAELHARERQLTASAQEIDHRTARLDGRETDHRAAEGRLAAANADAQKREQECRRREDECRLREDECRLREAALDSGSAGLASEAERIRQHNEAATHERAALDRDREALSNARARIDSERAELAALRRQLETDRASLTAARHEHDDNLRAAQSERTALEKRQRAFETQAKEQQRAAKQLTQRQEELTGQAALLDARRDTQARLDAETTARRKELEAERSSLAELRRALESERTELESERIALKHETAILKEEAVQVQARSAAVTQQRDELDGRERGLSEARRALESERKTLASDRRSFDQASAALATARQTLESDRNALEADRRQLETALAALETERNAAADDRRQLDQTASALTAGQKALESDRKTLAGEKNRLTAETATLAARAADLERQAAQLSVRAAEHLQIDTELTERATRLSAGEAKLEQSTLDLAKRASNLKAHEAQVTALRQENDTRRDALEQQLREVERTEAELGRSLAVLGQEHLEVEANLEEFERQKARLQEEEATLRATETEIGRLRNALERDRAQFNDRQAQLVAGQEALASSERAVEQERKRLDLVRGEINEQRLRMGDDRAAAEAARQELAKAQLELDERERRMTECEVDLSTRQITLAAESERLDAERERLDEWTRRLREEQAFARAAKKQFQSTVDEFRSENRRFQMAISAIRADRDRHRRRRIGSKQIAEDRSLAQILSGEGILDDAQAEWFASDQLGDSRLGGFELVEFLAKGTETWICEAIAPETKQRVALKILARPLASDADARRRLAAETRLGQTIEHSAVVRTLAGCAADEASPFLVLELVPGISLAELIALHGALPWREACNYAFQAAVGLGRLHEAGIVHRGVEPANLLVDREGGLKVADFGVADAAFLRGDTGQPSPPFETSCYSSPELLGGTATGDPQTDVFSLGCTIYHALGGSPPFADAPGNKGGSAATFATPAPLRSLVSDLPSEVVRIVKRMMTPDRSKRFASMSDVARALGPWARRQQAYFDRPSIVAQRSLDARARLRMIARQFAERQGAPESATESDVAPIG